MASVALAATGVGAIASGGIMAAFTAADTIATGAFYGKFAGEIALDNVKGMAVAGVGMLTAGIGNAVTTGLSTVANVATQAALVVPGFKQQVQQTHWASENLDTFWVGCSDVILSC